jgi:hypothetical protein
MVELASHSRPDVTTVFCINSSDHSLWSGRSALQEAYQGSGLLLRAFLARQEGLGVNDLGVPHGTSLPGERERRPPAGARAMYGEEQA